jgi:hypothetical protein
LPLSFETNQGQTDMRVKFLSHGPGYDLFLTGDEAVLNVGRPSADERAPFSLQSGIPNVSPPTLNYAPRTSGTVLRMRLVGANADAAVIGGEALPGKVNYFIGNDPKKWRTNIPTYARVKCQGVYSGVDLVYYGNWGGQLEYDFVVAPGADVRSIRLSFQGAGGIRVDKRTGDLVLPLDGSELRFRKPLMYQPASGPELSTDRQGINGRFILTGRNQIGFQVGAYDRHAPLIIDPSLTYSTYLGGSKINFGTRVAVDASGSIYVTGITNSGDFPTTSGVFDSMLHSGVPCSSAFHGEVTFSCPDAFVTKLNPAGTGLVYSTYLGGSQADGATGISVDGTGNAYVTGTTGSVDFPTTPGAFQTVAGIGRAHAFATKLNTTGSALIYSTYLAGSRDDVSTISALDSSGNLYVAGLTTSPNFPTTPGAFQTTLAPGSCTVAAWNVDACADGFIAKLNAQGSALVYSSYLGGSNEDAVFGLAVDSAGSAYATGATLSTDFPIANALQSSFGATNCGTAPGGNPATCFHAFVTKVNPEGTGLSYSTYLSGNGYDAGFGIAVDASGAAYVTGATNSSQFPTTSAAAQSTFGGGSCGNPLNPFNCADAFVAKLAPTGSSLEYSTYLGGTNFDFGMSIAVDSAGNAHVVGGTNSLDFPIDLTSPGFKGGTCNTIGGGEVFPGVDDLSFNIDCPNAFLTILGPTGSTRLFSTYLGGGAGDVALGVAVDASGSTYVAGSTLSANFPTVNALQPSLTGYADAFVSKFTGTLAWQQVPGSLSRISVGSDGTVWGLNSAGQVWMFNPQTHTWQQIPGLLTQIAVGSSGVIWGLNAAGQIYRYDPSSQNWVQIPGILSQIAVGADGDVWGINAGSQVFHFNAATQTWVQVPGLLTQLAVGYDGAVWGLNMSQQVYRFNPGTQSWQQVAGLLTQVAVGGDGDVWGINSAGQAYHFNTLSQQWQNTGASLAQLAVGSASNVWGLDSAGNTWNFNGQTQAWNQVPGQLVQIAVGENGAVWGLNSANQIYELAQPTQATQTLHAFSGPLAQVAVGLDGEAWGLDASQHVWHFSAPQQSWQQVPGSLGHIAVGFGGNVWGLNAAGQIWQFNPSTQGWNQMPGLLAQIAVGADGSVWGLDSGNRIWRFNSASRSFAQIAGSLTQLSVGADGTVWGINSAGQIWRFNAATQGWDSIPGTLSQLAVGSASNVWGINAAGQVWQYNAQNQTWDSIPGVLTSIAVAFDGTVWGLNSAQQVWRFNAQTQSWDSIAGQMSQISVGADAVVWGLSASGQTYEYW